MSDELLTPDKLAHIAADLEAEDAIYERRQPVEEGEDIKGRKASGAEMALAWSVGAHVDHALVAEPQDLSWAKQDNIEKDGCQFIDAIYLFLDELGCPPDARDFVLAIAGISRGNYSDLMPITDDQIGRRMGLHRNAIRRKRKSLVDWEQKNNWSVLEIHEKEFNREKMRYKPTEYKVTVTPYAARFIREYRSRTSYKQGYKALENNIAEDTKEIAGKIAEDLPFAPIVKRQQKRAEAVLGSKPRKVETPDKDLQFINSFDGWCLATMREGQNLRVEFENMLAVLNGMVGKYADKQEREVA